MAKGNLSGMKSTTVASARTDRGQAYRKARRHSGGVRFMRIALPAAAFLLIAVFAGATIFRQALPDNVNFTGVGMSDGKLVMNNPKLSGNTKKGAAYTMTASRAIQDLAEPSLVRLEDIKAEVPVEGQGLARLDASSGLYARDTQRLELDEPFDVTTEGGMKARLMSASVDLKGGNLETDDPVDIRLPEAHIAANRFSITDRGTLLVFENEVRMTIYPSAAGSKEPPTNSVEE